MSCDIDIIENVQRAFTRKVFYLCHLPPASYDDTLAHLGLERLELRRIRYDLVLMFKIVHGLVQTNLQHAQWATRGHRYKLSV